MTSNNLLEVFAVIDLVWNTPWNSVFIYKIFQLLFTVLGMTGSVLLYVNDSAILFLLIFHLLKNSCFHSILSTFLIFSSRTPSLYCLLRNFCLVIGQFLLYLDVVEENVSSLLLHGCCSLEILSVLIYCVRMLIHV